MNNRYSVGSLGSLVSSSSDGVSIDSSIVSMTSTCSSGSLGYEIESEVGREALKEICCSALSRALDFPDCQLETLLGYDEENSTGDTGGVNVAKNITTSFRSMKRGLNALYRQRHHHSHQSYQVSQEESNTSLSALSFGSPLNESDQGTLLQLITHMNTFISREGIFRKSGNKGRMDQLVGGLEKGCFGEIILNAMYNAHDFASVLKQYFSELPEPLLLKRHLNAYLQAAVLSSLSSKLQCLQLLMLLLPPVHRVVLQHLLDLLFQVARSPDNKMDSHNLSLVFAPTLFLASRSESLPQEDFGRLSQLLAYMIENCEDIFEVPPEVRVVAERYCRKRSRRNQLKNLSSPSLMEEQDGGGDGDGEEDLPIDMCYTSCKRQCVEDFHETGKDQAMDEVAKLYELVKNMPDGPQKAHFMKRFESASKAGCTPSSVPKKQRMSSISRLKKSLRRNKGKENAMATPKISANQIQLLKPCFKKGSLASEFDMVDGSETPSANIEATRSDGPSVTPPSRNGTKPQNDFKTPSDFTSVFKTPGDDFKTPGSVFKTPSGDFTTPGSAFKTPKIHSHGVCKVRMIPTKSPMVTDV